MKPPFHSPSRAAKRGRKGALLIVSLMAIFIAMVIVGIMVQASSSTITTNLKARQDSDAMRYATNLLEYGAAEIKYQLNQPSSKTPNQTTLSVTPLTSAQYQSVLGVDTTRYTVVTSPNPPSITLSPVQTIWNAKTMTGTGLLTMPNMMNPINKISPIKNQFVANVWTVPIIATLKLKDNATGRLITESVSCNLEIYYTPFLQYSYYFNAINAQISQGEATEQKGGIFGNQTVNLWTNDWGGLGWGAIIQVDNIAANKIMFNNLNSGPIGSNNYFNGVYISAGPIDVSGQLSYFAAPGTPLTGPYNPYNPATATTNFLPAFQTIADMGVTSPLANYFNALSPANLTAAGLSSTLPKNGTENETEVSGIWNLGQYSKIDSSNAQITTLAQRFNGNFIDANTGFLPMAPANMPPSMLSTNVNGITTPPVINPHAMIEAPTTAGYAASQTELTTGVSSSAGDAENAKFAYQSNFYVLIENPTASTSAALPPVVFNSPVVALNYKTAAAGLSNTAKLALRATYAANIIAVPSGIIQTQRSFYDMSQQEGTPTAVAAIPAIPATSTTPAVPGVPAIPAPSPATLSERISAVDINMGALRTAIGTATTATTLAMQNGAAWDANNTTGAGWNGVIYVDVANPLGPGWVSNNKSSPAGVLVYPTTGTNAGILTNQSTGAAVADPLSTATEQSLVAVRLYDANTVPNRSGASGYTGPAGCTIATNTAVYTVGDINADGLSTTDKDYGYSFAASGTTGGEPNAAPFAIVCDSLTAFSSAYYQGDSTHTNLAKSDAMLNTINGIVTQPAGFDDFHEMDFALITGGTDASFRGGYGGASQPAFVINIPIGETRTNLNVRYRGARNVLFQSDYNKKYFNNVGTSYENSNDEAFDQSFKTGLASMPPGIPNVKAFSLIGLKFIAPPVNF